MRAHLLVQRVDWFRVLADLDQNGVNNAAAARELGVLRTTLWNWKNGAEPKHYDGCRLIDLWAERTGRDQAAAPVVQEVRAPR